MASRSAGQSFARWARSPFPIQRRELLLIFVFWTFIAVLTSANRLLDLRGQSFRAPPASAATALAFVDAYLWALLTPVIFWLASRFSLEGTVRWRRIAMYFVVGVVVALVVSSLVDLVRDSVMPAPPRRRGPGGGGGGGGPRGGGLFLFGGPPRLWALNDLVIYMGVLAAGIARNFSMRARTHEQEAIRLEAQLAEARLDSLRRQLDPHFLFNTLNAISALVERDPRGVRRMIARLSDLLRRSIERPPEPENELSTELELLDQYLDIMRIRFQGRLQVEQRIDPDVRNALVPSLVLQPIVENAVVHGVARLQGEGRIGIEAARDNGAVVFRVSDNGPGVGGEPPDGSEGGGGGVGIRNTLARLEQLYGDDASFTLRAVESGGTVAELRLPYHTRADLRVAGHTRP
jgi:signal transduction histidine kinase